MPINIYNWLLCILNFLLLIILKLLLLHTVSWRGSPYDTRILATVLFVCNSLYILNYKKQNKRTRIFLYGLSFGMRTYLTPIVWPVIIFEGQKCQWLSQTYLSCRSYYWVVLLKWTTVDLFHVILHERVNNFAWWNLFL